MIDLGREIAAAVRPDWNALREDAAHAGLRLRRRRRSVARGAAVAAVLAVAVIAVARHELAVAPEVALNRELQLAGDALAVPVGEASELRAIPAPPGHVTVELVRGTGHFQARTATFEVRSGLVTVVATNAVFACARSGERTRVEVFRGSVEIRAPGEQRVVSAGEIIEMPAAAAAAPPPERVPAPQRPAAASASTWRGLAHGGEYDRAYAALGHVRDVSDDLLLAADVMRLSHHPAEAVAPLRRMVRDHAADPRASLAAFTLGRVLLDELGQPREAADAFADAIRLASDGPMAEDALARQVEALSRAGESTAALHVAEDYLLKYPSGRKVRSVRRFGGLE